MAFTCLTLFSFPASRYLSYSWNVGSFLGLLLLVQVSTGLFLALYYSSDPLLAFDSVQYVCREVSSGWFLRAIHFDGASFIFIASYLHLCKALFLGSSRLVFTWLTGSLLLVLVMGVAFTGYVLVWSQMSYWAAVVITSLLSSVPVWGESLLLWVWGGYSVGIAALKLCFVVHFFMPFILLLVVLVHLLALHKSGSTTFLGYSGSLFKVSFFPYYAVKDLVSLIPISLILLFLLSFPYCLGDPEMFEVANSIVSPVHIVPEWYFLFAYAILRSIPSKSLGSLSIVLGLLAIPLLTFSFTVYPVLSSLVRVLTYSVAFNFVFLSWVGQCSLEPPYLYLGQISLTFYFFLLGMLLYPSLVSEVLYRSESSFSVASVKGFSINVYPGFSSL